MRSGGLDNGDCHLMLVLPLIIVCAAYKSFHLSMDAKVNETDSSLLFPEVFNFAGLNFLTQM
jgi:hypothetical protein